MARLIDQKGNTKEVSSDDVKSYLAQGYAFSPDEVVTVESPDGEFGTMEASEATEFLRDQSTGYRYLSPETLNEIRVRDQYDNAGGQAQSFAEGTARALSFGASDLALEGLGVDPQGIEDRKVLGGALAGEAAAFLAPWEKIGRVGKFAGAGIKALDKVSRKGADLVTKAAIASKLGKKAPRLIRGATQGAIEGGIYEGAQGLSEQMLGDSDFNGEAAIARAKNGIVYGAGLGGLFGGAGDAIKKLKIGEKKLLDNVNKLKGEKYIPTDRKIGNVKLRTDNKMSWIPNIKGRFSEETGNYIFDVGNKTAVEVSEKLDGLNILDMNTKEGMNKLGDNMGFYDLIDHAEYTGTSSPQTIVAQAINKAKTGKVSPISERSKLLKQMQAVKSGWNRLLKKKNRTKLDNQKIGRLRRSYETKKAQLAPLKDAQEYFNKISHKRAANVMKEFDGIRLGDDLYIVKPDKFDDFNVGSYIEYKKPFKQPRGDEDSLRAFGAKKSVFRKLREKKGEEQFKSVGKYASRIVKEEPFFSSLDSISDRVRKDQATSITGMNNSIDTMAAYFNNNNIDSRLTYDALSSHIGTKILPALEGLDGLPKSATKNLHAKMKAQADEYRGYQKILDEETLMGQRTSSNLGPDELRKERMSLDDSIRFDKQSGDFTSNEAYLSIRRKMESMLEGSAKNHEELTEALSSYKGSKKLYQDTINMEMVLDEGIRSEQGNNRLGLTSYLSGGTGAGIAATLDPSLALAGAAIGTAGREASRRYGDKFMAVYGDKIYKAKEGVQKSIKKSTKAFLDAPSSKIVIPAVAVFTPRELELRHLKDYQNYVYDIQPIIENFNEKNEFYEEYLPETAAATKQTMLRGMKFLNSKMPKNPYGTNYFKKYTPPEMEMRRFERYKNAVSNPLNVIKEISSGYTSVESIEVLKEVYPSIYESIKLEFIDQLYEAKPDYRKRIQLNKMFGIDTDYYLRPENVQFLQQSSKLISEEEEVGANQQKSSNINKDDRMKTDSRRVSEF